MPATPAAGQPTASNLDDDGTGMAGDAGHGRATRRAFLLLSMSVLISGCSGAQKTSSTSMPGPSWRVQRSPAAPPSSPTYEPMRPSVPSMSRADAMPMISRTSWSPNTASPRHMNRMNGVRFITVHHDGINPFYDSDESSTRQRVESIRRFHRDDRGWGDIGYHYIIDRQGRIWEGRSIDYQGAHVGNHNEHNVGVLLLGHFDQQSPSDLQLRSMQSFVSHLMRQHHVPIGRVTTHREWETARTVCPGHALQLHMDRLRRRGQLG